MGAVFRSSKSIPLTESELEYLVDVVKHVFPEHVVLQFTIKNTIPEQLLTNVNIDIVPSDEETWTPVCAIVCVLFVCRCACVCHRVLLCVCQVQLPSSS